MIELNDNAKKTLEQYLQRVRAYLHGCKTVDTDEIEQNIMEHIENEFAATEPISVNELNIVLEKLGSPRQWIKEAAVREEELGAQIRLIYPLLILMYLILALLTLLWPWFFIAHKLICLLQATSASGYARALDASLDLNSQASSLLLGCLIAGSYWVGLGVVFLIRPKWLSFLLRPFADKFTRTFARLVLLFGSGIALAFAILFIWWQYA
jgi:hypothetical protein